MGEPTVYNHTEMTEITQYNTEEASTFGGGKKYVPVFHGLQQRPGEDNPIQYYEGHVEIGGPSQTPWDLEEFDDEILAQSGRERDIHPDAIAVSPTTGTVKLATPLVTLQLSATVTPTTSEFPVNWSTSSNKVTVSSTGLVTPVSVGEDIAVTASSGAVSASAVIKVEKVNVNSVTIKQSGETVSSIDILPEATAQLTATVLPNNAYIKTVSWTSSDETVATVSDAGLVTAIAEGTATITATSTDNNNKKGTCTVNVKIPVESVTLDEETLSLAPEATAQLTATVLPADATVNTVAWSSSDETIATVSNTGLVTAVADGIATITATSTDDNTKSASCEVTVDTPAETPEETPEEPGE